MFIYIRHGDNEQFLANINCTILQLLLYTRKKVGLTKTDIIDLCEENGTMKMFFLMKTPRDYATNFLTSRNTYLVCKIERGLPGTRIAFSYRAFVPLLKNPEPELLESLRTQCETLERSRVKMLRIQEAKKTPPVGSSVKRPSKLGRHNEEVSHKKGPPYKPRADLIRKDRHR
ncbi:uncharacterized protein CXorf65 homolog [Suncus etruscus]|uniref:uncharacterized protein CXorf65 homolog n=1 Tax=Suncus etruscus TaxID=109475 RepID=UPI0021103C7E|nr:uncharacterized protein CXorf65 homolog [Suncus etruscus]